MSPRSPETPNVLVKNPFILFPHLSKNTTQIFMNIIKGVNPTHVISTPSDTPESAVCVLELEGGASTPTWELANYSTQCCNWKRGTKKGDEEMGNVGNKIHFLINKPQKQSLVDTQNADLNLKMICLL